MRKFSFNPLYRSYLNWILCYINFIFAAKQILIISHLPETECMVKRQFKCFCTNTCFWLDFIFLCIIWLLIYIFILDADLLRLKLYILIAIAFDFINWFLYRTWLSNVIIYILYIDMKLRMGLRLYVNRFFPYVARFFLICLLNLPVQTCYQYAYISNLTISWSFSNLILFVMSHLSFLLGPHFVVINLINNGTLYLYSFT